MSHAPRRLPAYYPVAVPRRTSLLLFGLALLAALAFQVGLAMLCTSQPALAVALAVVGAVSVWWYKRLNANGYRVGPAGLERLRGPRRERWSWDELQVVHFEHEGLRLETARGELRIGAEVTHWAALGERLCDELNQPSEAPDATVVPAAQIEAWLGVPPGGALSIGRPSRRHGRLAVVFGLAGCCLLGVQSYLASALVGLAIAEGLCWLTAHHLVADGRGVSEAALGCRRFIPWTALRGATVDGWRVELLTTRGSITCRAGKLAHKLYYGAKAMLAAREAGAALPRMGAVSSTALSRAKREVGVERGLSRGDGGEA